MGVEMGTHECDGATTTAETGETERGGVRGERGQVMAVHRR